MSAGQLRAVLDLYEPVETLDASGGAAPTPRLVAKNVRGKIETTGGSESLRGQQVEAGIDSEIKVYYRTGVKPEMYFVERVTNRRFNIVRASDPDGRRQWLVCQCQEKA